MVQNEVIEEFYKKINETSLDNITDDIFPKSLYGGDMRNACVPFINNLLELIITVKKCNTFEAINSMFEYIKDESKLLSLISDLNSSNNYIQNFLNLKDSVKTIMFKYMEENIQKYLDKIHNDLNDLVNKSNIEYKNISKDIFKFNGSFYYAKNVIFNNLMVDTFNIFTDNLDDGLKITDDIKEQYKNVDLKKVCSDLIVKDGCAEEWDERITSSDEAYRNLSDKVMEMNVSNDEVSIWFENNNVECELYGGHNPKLYLHSGKDYKFATIE